MSENITLNGGVYIIPDIGEIGWGQNLTNFFVAIPAGVLQKTAGLFTLTADVDFGPNFGVKSPYFKSDLGANIAATGVVRLQNTDGIAWRNAAHGGDLTLGVNGSDQLTFGGVPVTLSSLSSAHIFVGSASNVATDVAVTGDVAITNAGATSVNSVQAGVITNAMVNAAAAIAYSKLTLTGSIVDADIATAAAVAITKIANGTADQVLGTNHSGTGNEWKTITGTANEITVTGSAGAITLATPQAIGTASTPTFGGVTLSNTGLTIKDTEGTPKTVNITTPATLTSTWTLTLPVSAGTNNFFLKTDGSGNTSWAAGGSGTVNSGTANQLGYYATTSSSMSGLSAITGNKALASDVNGLPVASTTTDTELGYIHALSAISATLGTITTSDSLNSAIGKIINARVVQIISATSTTAFTTSSASFQASNLSAAITPKSSSNKVLIIASGPVSIGTQNTAVLVTLTRGGTNLGATNGFVNGSVNVVGTSQWPACIVYLDSPAATTATTYAVAITAGGSSCTFGDTSRTQSMVLIEIGA